MVTTQRIDNTEDILDTRDIPERIAALQADNDRDEEETDELAALVALIEEVRSCAGDSPEDGVVLIRDSYFVEYAEEIARDIGAISSEPQWPQDHIDWDAAADALKMDYTEIDFGGVSYWAR